MPNPLFSDDPMASEPVTPVDLAARLAARLCHDFISPVSAIVSGLDLIEDPEQQDMREEAMTLIASSARKLAAHLSFARIAFGGSAASESFDVRELERLAQDLFEHSRAQLEWTAEVASLEKPAARAMLNLAQLGASVLPVGGTAKLSAREGPVGGVRLELEAVGPRAKIRPEAVDGLEGRPFGEGLAGHWVQAFFLRSVVDQAGGKLELTVGEERIEVTVGLPR
jgi:histidine phosphotransferase ChpT